MSRRVALRELAGYFLRLGATAFGGPAAHVALMEEDLVRRRRWLAPDEFLELLGAANLLPGPTSTELAMLAGARLAGGRGLVVAGACFAAPAVLLCGALGAAYVRWGALPATAAVAAGLAPVVVAVLAQALVTLARAALRSAPAWAVVLAAAALSAAGAHPLLVLALSGALMLVLRARSMTGGVRALLLPLVPAAGAGVPATGLLAILAAFLPVGALLYGSGYALLAFLRADLVTRLGWLSERQLLDAVTAGQLTPGPVFATATFIGYLLHGVPGAAVATVGIFLPSFLLAWASGPLLARVRGSAPARLFLEGASIASVALLAVVSAQLARPALTGFATIGAFAVALALLLLARWPAWWVLAGGVLFGVARAL